MRVIRTHVDAPLAVGAVVTLDEQASGHLVRVLRRQVGDPCVLFNGDGVDYHARLVTASRKGATAEVHEAVAALTESTLDVVLVQALARGEKMDWVLQKATELGVAAIVPVLTERTEVRLGGDRVERRLAHWRGVVAAACEQCGRARLPSLHAPLDLATHAATRDRDRLGLVLDPEASIGLGGLPPGDRIEVVIGPEGGLSERDLAALGAAGYVGVRLGPRVLRTETAGPAVLAALQVLRGDLG